MIYKILFLLLSYLIGSISPSYFLGKYIYKTDLREHGSGNLGTTNSMRVLGKKAGIITLIFDISKALVMAIIAANIFNDFNMAGYSGFFAFLGHVYPFYLHFKGGKGVATFIGLALYIFPVKIVIIFAIIALLMLFISKTVSLGSITAMMLALGYSIYRIIYNIDRNVYICVLIICIIGIYKHKGNIKRLINGNERKIGERNI